MFIGEFGKASELLDTILKECSCSDKYMVLKVACSIRSNKMDEAKKVVEELLSTHHGYDTNPTLLLQKARV